MSKFLKSKNICKGIGKFKKNKLLGTKISEEVKLKMSTSQLNNKDKSKKPVRCIETGEVFESIRDASRKYNISGIGH